MAWRSSTTPTHRRLSVSRREWRRVLLYALALALLTTLPYVLAWAVQGDDWVFSGFLFGVEDGHSYLGKMRLGARGLWAFHLFYTLEDHSSAPLIFLPYILPGQLVGLFVSADNPALTSILVVVFHALRVVFDVLLVLVIYRFVATFIRSPATRFLALVLATLGGGLGWLLALLGQDALLGSLPPEFFIPEGFTFLILLGLPHLALARTALLGGLLALLAAVERDGWGAWRWAGLAGVSWLVVALAVPFYVVILYCILGAWGLATWLGSRAFPWRLFTRCVVAAGLVFPLLVYYTLAFSRNPAFAQWSAQNLLPSPHPLHYLLAYGVLGVLAWAGGRWAWRRVRSADGHYALLVGWVLVVPLLVYLPLNVQRRMAEAVLIPLAILAAAGLRLWARTPLGRRLKTLTLLVTMSSSLFLLLGSFLTALRPASPVFLPAGQVAVFNWLNSHAAPDEAALAAMPTGNALPAWTNLRPFVGHGPETLYAVEKQGLVELFYSGTMPGDERRSLYGNPCYRWSEAPCATPIRYVLYGPAERALGGTASPEWIRELTLVYDRDGYQIYQVPPS